MKNIIIQFLDMINQGLEIFFKSYHGKEYTNKKESEIYYRDLKDVYYIFLNLHKKLDRERKGE